MIPEIERVWQVNLQVYGADKVWRQLNREGVTVARCTVERLMRRQGLRGVMRGKVVRTTISDNKAPCPLDRVNRQFKAQRPNQLWVSDFTYVSTWQGWLYVAFVIDVFARRIVGWRVSSSMHTDFVLDALEQALYARQPSPEEALIHHSDIAAEWADKNLFKIAKQIHEVTDVPLLPPQKYRNLLTVIATDVAESPFHLMETGKSVRDRCRESGLPISRADVTHVLRGLVMRGHVFEQGPNDAATLAKKLGDNIRSLCLREQIVLDGVMDKAIKDWIGST